MMSDSGTPFLKSSRHSKNISREIKTLSPALYKPTNKYQMKIELLGKSFTVLFIF